MKFARLRHSATSALAVLLISGAGIAFAGNGATAGAASAPAVAPAVATPTQPTSEPSAEPVEPAGADTDALQSGDQTTPDTAAGNAAEAAGPETEKAGAETEKAGAETEKAGAEEPGDANLPGGGHADNANDPNADHQFEGVE